MAEPTIPVFGGLTDIVRNVKVSDRAVRFQIQNLYHFQLAAGVVVSTMKDEEFQQVKRTAAAAGSTPASTELIFVPTVERSYRFFPTVEVLYYPSARSFFPRYKKADQARVEHRQGGWQDVGALIGFSASQPTKDFIAGGVWMPGTVGVGLKFGWHFGFREALPKGVEPNKPVTGDTIFLEEGIRHGFFFGASLNTQLFKDLFGLIFKKP